MTALKGQISDNLNAFLDTLAFAEGTSTSPITQNDGYDVIVTGIDASGKATPETFTDYSSHPFLSGRPSKKINRTGLTSNASGRYQFMLVHYLHYKKLLALSDFGPINQDRWAIQLIKERRALELIHAGKFDEAVAKVSNLWASLPGANYKDQKMRELRSLRDYYISKGGKLWVSNGLSVDSSPLLEQSSPHLKSVDTKVEQKLTQPTVSIEPKKTLKESLIQILKLLTGK